MANTEGEDRLTPADIIQLCWESQTDEAGIAPADARRLIEAFCEHVEGGQPVPADLLDHLSRALREYLTGDKRLDAALGLVRRRGQPKAVAQRQAIALALLRHRATGMTHQDAVTEVSEEFGRSESVVGEAFAEYRHEAAEALAIEPHLPDEEGSAIEALPVKFPTTPEKSQD